MIGNDALDGIATLLNQNNITWGIGGSFLLYIHGLYDNPNDLDIWIEPAYMQKVKKIFSSYEKIETNIQLPKEYHLKIRYLEVEVDFVSCFIVTPNKHSFSYYISPHTIKNIKLQSGIVVPCTLLEDWYLIYKILRRESKAAIIEEVFVKNKIPFSDKMLKASLSRIDNNIQKRVIRDAGKMIVDSLQYSVFDYIRKVEEKESNEQANTSTKIDCQ